MLLYAAMMAADETVAMAHAEDMEQELLSFTPGFWGEMVADFLDAFVPMRWHVIQWSRGKTKPDCFTVVHTCIGHTF